MKKIFLVVTILVSSITLTACGNLYCNGCGKISLEKKHKLNVYGSRGYLCDDCYEMIDKYID